MMRLSRFFQIAALILLAVGAQPAYSAFWQWSKTASNNASADPTINWAEGMSPSSINDSARAMMARAAEYRDDISGSIGTGGTSTAYTLATNQGLGLVPTDGQMIAFTPNSTNGVGATLRVDGGTIYPIQSSSGVGVSAGTLISGTPYTAKLSIANAAWMLRDFYGSAYSIPLGGVLFSAMDTPPNSNFAYAAGQCISRTTYAAFFTIAGTRFGACDGSTTFGVPDLRGRVVAGLDDMGDGSGAASRLTNSATGCGTTIASPGATCVNGSESQTLTVAQIPGSIPVTVTGSASVTSTVSTIVKNTGGFSSSNAPGGLLGQFSDISAVSASSISSTGSSAGTGTASGSGSAHPNVQPLMGLKVYVRIF